MRTNRPLYEVGGRTVCLLDGAYPAYRTLTAGLTGKDVRQLERNLRVLGFDEDRQMRVDRTWDTSTTAAVRSWKLSKGIDDTGSIELSLIAFQPGTRRVGTVVAVTGSPAGPAVGDWFPRMQERGGSRLRAGRRLALVHCARRDVRVTDAPSVGQAALRPRMPLIGAIRASERRSTGSESMARAR